MSTETLPFDEKRQLALLGYLLLNDRFFTQCKDRIQPNWFNDVWAGKVWNTKLNFFKTLKRNPLSWEEFMNADDFRLESQGNRTRMKALAEEARVLTKSYGLDGMIPELSTWLHAKTFLQAQKKAEDLYNQGKFEEAYGIMDQCMSTIKSTNFDDDPKYDWDRIGSESRLAELKGGLTFGLKIIDKLISPLGDTWNGEGSLLLGDATLLIAPTNLGKTSVQLNIAAANILNERDTCILTHEGSADDVADKLAMSILNRNRAQLYAMRNGTKEERYWFGNAIELLKRRVEYIPINKGANYVEDVEAVFLRAQDRRRAETGKGFDLLVDDYPGKLITKMSNLNSNKRTLDEIVCNYFVQLALNQKLHAVFAQQGNRTAGKINRGAKGFEDRLLSTDDGNESQGPANISVNALTINRSPWDEYHEFLTYYIGKSRSSKKGWAVCCKTNFSNAITHSDTLGCTYYHGNVPLGEAAESMWIKYRNQEIPRVQNVETVAEQASPKK